MNTRQGAILHPAIDFWLQGGLSLPLFLGLYLVRNGFWPGVSVQPFLASASVFFAAAGVWINTPHFYSSYRLAYSGGLETVRKYRFQLRTVPIILLALFVWSYYYYRDTDSNIAVIAFLGPIADFLGFGAYVRSYPGVAQLMMGTLFVVQYTAVAWHYSKQAYGMVAFGSRAESYVLRDDQLRSIRWALYGVAACYVTEVNSGIRTYQFGGIAYRNLGWPTNLPVFFEFALILAWVWILWSVVYANWKTQRRLPPARVWSPFLAAHLWFVPLIYLSVGPEWFMLFVPFFHGIQYLPFVLKVDGNKKGRLDPYIKSPLLRVAVLYAVTAAVGFALSHRIPVKLDPVGPAQGFFTAWAYLALNIHHYFIDNAIWRQSNLPIRAALRGAWPRWKGAEGSVTVPTSESLEQAN